jgi:hypothetical protein
MTTMMMGEDGVRCDAVHISAERQAEAGSEGGRGLRCHGVVISVALEVGGSWRDDAGENTAWWLLREAQRGR